MRFTVTLLSLLLFAPAAARADGPRPSPSPSPAAKKDKDKAKPAEPAKVFTNEDLKTAGAGSGSVTFLPERPEGASAEPAPAQNAGSESGVATESGSAAESGESRNAASESGVPNDEQSWRARAKEQREGIKSAENEIKRLEDQLRDLELDRDPNPQDLLDPQRLQKREALKAETRTQLEATRAQLEAARQAFEALEREARLAGVPPAWLEER
jgi:hypothetical protein